MVIFVFAGGGDDCCNAVTNIVHKIPWLLECWRLYWRCTASRPDRSLIKKSNVLRLCAGWQATLAINSPTSLPEQRNTQK